MHLALDKLDLLFTITEIRDWLDTEFYLCVCFFFLKHAQHGMVKRQFGWSINWLTVIAHHGRSDEKAASVKCHNGEINP